MPELPTSTAHPWPVLILRSTYTFSFPVRTTSSAANRSRAASTHTPGAPGIQDVRISSTAFFKLWGLRTILTPWGWTGQGSYIEIVERVEGGGTLTGEDTRKRRVRLLSRHSN